jgi:hypothetical protein
MDEQQTCGRGLAEHSVLPERLAEVIEAMADNLRVHMQALELDDEPAREEHAVYLRLAEEQRQAAGRLRAIAGEMAAARDLPMGRHDLQALTSPEVATPSATSSGPSRSWRPPSRRWPRRTSGCWPR